MKKKILLSVFTLAVVTITAFTGYKAYVPKATVADLLLNENIEALTQNEDEEKSGCKTQMDYYSSVTEFEGHKSGKEGMVYTCIKGNFSECKSGFAGDEYSMTPYPDTHKTINEVVTTKCK